jgi:Flp pilus assembly protein TadG
MARMKATALWRRVAQLFVDRRGIAAVEFALIAPLLLALYFVTMEVSLAIEASKKVDRIGSMVADLVTQQSSVPRAELENMMQLGQATLQPYNRSMPKIVVTEIWITDDPTPKVQVVWSRQMINGAFSAPYAKNSATTVPEQLKVKNSYLIRVESHLDYKPLITWSGEKKPALGLTAAFDNISMGQTYYLRPRLSASVGCDDC